jgi:hypothetical protein
VNDKLERRRFGKGIPEMEARDSNVPVRLGLTGVNEPSAVLGLESGTDVGLEVANVGKKCRLVRWPPSGLRNPLKLPLLLPGLPLLLAGLGIYLTQLRLF